MIPFADIESATIDLDAFDDFWNKDVGVGVSVAVGVGGKIVRHQITAHCDELRDRLAVVARDSRCKILRRLDPTGGGFDGISGNGDGRTGTSGVSVKQILANENLLRRIGREDVGLVYVSRDGDVVDA